MANYYMRENEIIKTDKPIKIHILFSCAFFLFLSGCAAKSPLMKASEHGNISAVQKLIKEGIRINERDDKGYTPLMCASWSGRTEIVKLLISNGADVNAKDSTGYTPLMYAISSEKTETAKLLINNGADVNAKDSAGQTPLLLASSYGYLDIAKRLIEKGADVNSRNHDKSSPLLLALAANNHELSILLLNKGADVNVEDGNGTTPLIQSTINGDYEITKILIEKGADINARNHDKSSSLLLALAANNHELSMLLLNKGADVNVEDGNGTTPLIQSVINGDYEISKILIEKGADLFAADSFGYKASDYAKFSLKTSKRVFKPNDYERSLAFLDFIKKAEKQQIETGKMNARNPQMARIYSIAYKVGKCINPDINYDVFISDKEEPNAWVNVSGNITFTKGALKKFDEETLTFMAAHEIAHDKLGHVAKKMAVSHTITGAMVVANILLPGAGLLNHIINPTITNNYSKTQEYDADKLASDFCAKCFGMSLEKHAAIMQKIEIISKTSGGGFWATHPSWNDRIKNINGAIKSPVMSMEASQSQKGIDRIAGIELLNGNVIEGQIISMNADVVKIRTKDGKVSSYSFAKEVRRIIKE